MPGLPCAGYCWMFSFSTIPHEAQSNNASESRKDILLMCCNGDELYPICSRAFMVQAYLHFVDIVPRDQKNLQRGPVSDLLYARDHGAVFLPNRYACILPRIKLNLTYLRSRQSAPSH